MRRLYLWALPFFVYAVCILVLKILAVDTYEPTKLLIKRNANLIENLSFVGNLENELANFKEKIVIATVICYTPGNYVVRNEAEVMIKSVIISWMMFKFEASLEFHLFLEHKEDEDYFLSKIKEYGHPFANLDLRLIFHSAMNTIPKEYHDKMQFDKMFRCMYIRLFFPDLLKDVDSVMYLDTDVLITGNLSTVWNYFREMKGEQLIGIVQVFHKNSPLWSEFFLDIPVPPPKGLASGLLLMNLTKMREYKFIEKTLQVYKDYTKIVKKMNDQKLINILLYYDKGIWYEMPCQFSFWFQHCRNDSYCSEAISDKDGIHVIQGAASRFEKDWEFSKIFKLYQKVNISSSALDLRKDLIYPVKEAYSLDPKSNLDGIEKTVFNKCDGIVDKLVFKSIK